MGIMEETGRPLYEKASLIIEKKKKIFNQWA